MNIRQKFYTFFATALLALLASCTNKPDTAGSAAHPLVIKGLYSFGPEIKSFADCDQGREYWVADSANTLELAYTNLGFEKPYTPVYIEVECHLVKTDTTVVTGNYDSTMVVTKLLKISKTAPDGPCAQ